MYLKGIWHYVFMIQADHVLPICLFKNSTNSRAWREPAYNWNMCMFYFLLGLFNWKQKLWSCSFNKMCLLLQAANSSITEFGFLSYIIKLMTQVPSTVSALKCSISTNNKWKIVPKTSYRNNSPILCQIGYHTFKYFPPYRLTHMLCSEG